MERLKAYRFERDCHEHCSHCGAETSTYRCEEEVSDDLLYPARLFEPIEAVCWSCFEQAIREAKAINCANDERLYSNALGASNML